MATQQLSEKDPRHHTARIGKMLDEVIQHAREDVSKVDDRAAKALFETTAEVLSGLRTAYKHFDEGKEEAFRQ
jgi:hypothetical protein